MSAPDVRLWLARHGETEWSRTMRHTGRTDVPLTDRGREQAAALRPRLEAVTWSAILCSPLSRARETLQLALPGARPELADDLLERDYGAAEGVTTATFREDDPGWDAWTTAIPGAETIADLGGRADRAIARALAVADAVGRGSGGDGDDAGKPGPRNVLLVAHGHLLRALAARWIEQPAVLGAHLALDVSTISVLGHERERPVLRAWNAAV